MSKPGRNSELKLLLRHSLVYGAGRVLDRGLGFLMLPVYTRFLAPRDYGVLDIVYVTMGYIALVIDAGISDSVSRYYYAYDDAKKRNEVVSTAYITIGSIALIVTAGLILLAPVSARYLLDDLQYAPHFKLAFIGLFFGVFTDIGFAYLRIRKLSVLLTAVSTTKLFVSLSLNILFVVVLEKGVMGIILSGLISNGVFAVLMTLPILRSSGLAVSSSVARQMLRFGLPLVPSNLASTLVRSSDRYFVRALVSLADAGLYGLGYKFGLLVHQFITTPFIQIWTPRRLELMSEKGHEDTFASLFTTFMAVVCFVGLGISIFGDNVVRIMVTEEFWGAGVVIPWIVLGHIVLGLYYHFYIPILISKRTEYFIYVNFASGGLALLLNYILISRFGIMGAAYSTVASYCARVGLVYLFATKTGPLPFELRRTAILIGVGGVLYAASTYVVTSSQILEIALRSGFWLAYPLALGRLRFFGAEDSAAFAGLLARLGIDRDSGLARFARVALNLDTTAGTSSGLKP